MSRSPLSRPDLAGVLRTLRSQRGLTQEELGVRAGLHPVHISMIESGRRMPGIHTVDRILLAVDASWTEIGPLLDQMRATTPKP